MTTIHREIPIEECLNGQTRAESNLDDDSIEGFVAWTKDIERSRALRDLARERLDDMDTDLPEAQTLLWIDQAEVYAVCSACYHERRDGAWTGSTTNPNYQDLKRTMHERLREGVPCSFCRNDRIKDLKADLAADDDVAVEVTVIE